ncbi:DUF2691 family protein, partial [Clostridium sp. HBUAS56017]|uniref:DUF2691 family protein n=1 Tax=Clostridium sp. HBUAS56017 TaxID=2571128 RepID=UPI001177827A
NTSIFENSIVNGQEFFRCIQLKDYYLIFADIKAFKNESEITNVDTYDDFINSNCEIALFCTDTIDVELYCKNKVILYNIINNCKNFGVDDIQVLSRENNERIKFRI